MRSGDVCYVGDASGTSWTYVGGGGSERERGEKSPVARDTGDRRHLDQVRHSPETGMCLTCVNVPHITSMCLTSTLCASHQSQCVRAILYILHPSHGEVQSIVFQRQ